MKLKRKSNNVVTEIKNSVKVSNTKAQDAEKMGGNDILEPANFETAIEATGFGKYHILLWLLALAGGSANMFATTTMSFVIPIAQCDLNLSLEDKGLLNGVTYLGMIISGFFWGYLADTFGRRKLCVIGFLLNGLCCVLCSFSQEFVMVLVTKFFEGFIINGPFAALVTYLNEFHSAKYRAILPSVIGMINCLSTLAMPLLGWLILTKSIHLTIVEDFIVLRSWNIFLLVCSIPSLSAGIAFLFLPESPKFQMTSGKNKLAYKTFRQVYAWNSGKSAESYPVKALAYEANFTENTEDANKSKSQEFKDGWKQLMPLFHRPYGSRIVLVAVNQIFIMMGLNTLRLWLPQIFAAISNYQASHLNDTEGASLCTMLEILQPNQTGKNEPCVVNENIDTAYMNNVIVSLVGIGCYIIAAPLTRWIGKKFILAFSSITGGLCGFCMYFAQNETAAVILASTSIGLTGVSSTTMVSIAIDIFPTAFRAMTVALAMVAGRSGAMAGNLIFPTLLATGCLPPFIMIGILGIGGAILVFGLPNADLNSLE